MALAFEEKFLAKLLGIGAFFTTVFVVSGNVTDPVNVPKMLSLGVVSIAVAVCVASSSLLIRLIESKFLVITVLAFFLFMSISVVESASPLSQNIYGSYGRNNGFLTYLFLGLLLLSATTLRSSFEFLTKSLLFAGYVNIVYCLWVITFGDFIGWSNPYGNILGTFGNPNFIGSFLGIFFAAFAAICIDSKSSLRLRLSGLAVLPITAFEIIKSHAIQGRVVAAVGLGIIGFLYVKTKFGKLILLIYTFLLAAVGTLSLMGALQTGPLTNFIYKTSVSLRGQYWLAGYNTGKSHLVSGVGMDSFGDWYRRSRDAHALVLPGPNTVVNAAHNVPLDMFAFGGLPLFASYLTIVSFSLVSVIRVIKRTKSFDSTFAILVSAWAGYQVQSVISINQIGLAIWGWLLSGALIAYEKATRGALLRQEDSNKDSLRKRDRKTSQPTLILSSALGGLLGLLLALPPLTSDAKWRSAQVERTVLAIQESMVPSYFNQPHMTKYLMNIQALEESNLNKLSHEYALQAVQWNPEAFELWKVLYLLKNSTVAERNLALQNMKRLDPLNPDVTAIR